MLRRHFLKSSGLIVGASTLLPSISMSSSLPTLLPRALKPGDSIGLLSPSSSVSRHVWERALDNMSKMGFKSIYSDNVRVKKGFLAGTDAQRLDDIHHLFAHPEVKGIFCIRGGYGSQRLLADLDMDLIRKNPKVFVGFSDITALHLAIQKYTGLVCFHGPNAGAQHSEYSWDQYQQLLLTIESDYVIRNPSPLLTESNQSASYVINPGKVRGQLMGGNLTLISTLMGTPYEPDFKDKIVMLEDIGEAPYRIDRMLTQLKLAGKFKQARGLALGIFTDCEEKPDSPNFSDTLSLREVLTERLGDLGIPVIYGLPFGHLSDNAIWPVGGEAELDTADGQLRLLASVLR